MKISIIICTCDFKRFNDAIQAIGSLLKQKMVEKEIILIIDDNEELYHAFLENKFIIDNNINVKKSKKSGLSNARNLGASLATGDIVCFIDDDSITDKYYLEEIRKCYQDNYVIGAGGPIFPLWICGEIPWLPYEFYWTIGCSYEKIKNNKIIVTSNLGSNMSFRKDVFATLRFNESLGLNKKKKITGEEIFFSMNVLQNYPKHKIVFNKNAIVYHKIFCYRKKMRYVFYRCLQYGRASYFIKKNMCDDKYLFIRELHFLRKLTKNMFLKLLDVLFLKNIKKNMSDIIFCILFALAVLIGYVESYMYDYTKK